MKKILTLDLGTTMGWAARMGSGSIVHGTHNFKPRKFEGGGMRYARFEKWLDETCDTLCGIDELYFEAVRRHLGVDAAHMYGGFMATLTKWCDTKNIPYDAIPVGTIKKHATGKGNAGKPAMIQAAIDKGHEVKDDNEADAIALLYCVLKGKI